MTTLHINLLLIVSALASAPACSDILGFKEPRFNHEATLDCPLVRANCDGLPETGCETDLDSPNSCGDCDTKCSGDAPLCSAAGNTFECSSQCDPPGMICGSSCVDISRSGSNCGRCGHSCGGSDCIGGVCQPALVASTAHQLDMPHALAITNNAIFWAEQTRVRSCPLPQGCLLAPLLIADAYEDIRYIIARDGVIFFSGCRNCDDKRELYRCPASGCLNPAQSVSWHEGFNTQGISSKTSLYWRDNYYLFRCTAADCTSTDTRWTKTALGLPDMVSIDTDGDTIYIRASTGNLLTCPEAVGCDSPIQLSNSASPNYTFRAHSGKFYWLYEVPSLPAKVQVCSIGNCSGSTATLATDSSGVTELMVDTTGVYWINAMRGTIRHCPLTGCPAGGANTLATGRSGHNSLALGPGFVYWVEGNSIFKVAKP